MYYFSKIHDEQTLLQLGTKQQHRDKEKGSISTKMRVAPPSTAILAVASSTTATTSNISPASAIASATSATRTTTATIAAIPTTTMRNTTIGCFGAVEPHVTVYLETAWFDEHGETFYSFIHEICSCDKKEEEGGGKKKKDPRWTVDSIPHFYIGPEDMLTEGFKSLLREFNTSTCGPIYFGVPKNPNLTIVTTSYAHNFIHDEGENQYRKLINDTRYIFILHADDPSLEENAENVYFLTPRHKRYILPTYFPPSQVLSQRNFLSSVEGRQQQLLHQPPPIFLVLGTFQSEKGKRSLTSLPHLMEKFRDTNFLLRFLGGSKADNKKKEVQLKELHDLFPNDTNKTEFFLQPTSDEFMKRVAESDVILPLINGDLFRGKYSSGKRLTSSVAWGLGFHKKMVLYEPLAEVFGIQDDNVTYFLHGDDSSSFVDAFGRCLSQFYKKHTR